jgi:hypothetical protein
MKQTKKLTRMQRKILEKHDVDTRDCRLVEETKYYITVQYTDGTVVSYEKDV